MENYPKNLNNESLVTEIQKKSLTTLTKAIEDNTVIQYYVQEDISNTIEKISINIYTKTNNQ